MSEVKIERRHRELADAALVKGDDLVAVAEAIAKEGAEQYAAGYLAKCAENAGVVRIGLAHLPSVPALAAEQAAAIREAVPWLELAQVPADIAAELRRLFPSAWPAEPESAAEPAAPRGRPHGVSPFTSEYDPKNPNSVAFIQRADDPPNPPTTITVGSYEVNRAGVVIVDLNDILRNPQSAPFLRKPEPAPVQPASEELTDRIGNKTRELESAGHTQWRLNTPDVADPAGERADWIKYVRLLAGWLNGKVATTDDYAQGYALRARLGISDTHTDLRAEAEPNVQPNHIGDDR